MTIAHTQEFENSKEIAVKFLLIVVPSDVIDATYKLKVEKEFEKEIRLVIAGRPHNIYSGQPELPHNMVFTKLVTILK